MIIRNTNTIISTALVAILGVLLLGFYVVSFFKGSDEFDWRFIILILGLPIILRELWMTPFSIHFEDKLIKVFQGYKIYKFANGDLLGVDYEEEKKSYFGIARFHYTFALLHFKSTQHGRKTFRIRVPKNSEFQPLLKDRIISSTSEQGGGKSTL